MHQSFIQLIDNPQSKELVKFYQRQDLHNSLSSLEIQEKQQIRSAVGVLGLKFFTNVQEQLFYKKNCTKKKEKAGSSTIIYTKLIIKLEIAFQQEIQLKIPNPLTFKLRLFQIVIKLRCS
ncbi:unnamed protein product [Paramecium sonneborni]|uniref:Uncharacterized protein n=1 Tax=Paramecium sonneborni TaxID=65129 RepID=A0A8S1L7R0_9CILI|nr:unnamed protein product [Paramecium sonneborni]